MELIRYADKTEKELREMNGMGPDGLLNHLIPDSILLRNCREAANEHDVGYMRAETLADKLTADVVFYVNMARIIVKKSCWTLRSIRLSFAKARFVAVLKLGYEFIDNSAIRRPKYATAVHNAVEQYAYGLVYKNIDIEAIKHDVMTILELNKE